MWHECHQCQEESTKVPVGFQVNGWLGSSSHAGSPSRKGYGSIDAKQIAGLQRSLVWSTLALDAATVLFLCFVLL